MAKFRFRLKTLLDVKELKEKQAIVDYAEITKYFESQSQNLIDMKNKSDETTGILMNRASDGIMVHDIKTHSTYLKKIDKQIRIQSQVVEEIRAERKNLRAVLIKLRNEVETLGDLRERQYMGFKREFAKNEEKKTDEFVTYNFGINLSRSFRSANSKEWL